MFRKILLFLCTVNDSGLQTSSVRKADNCCILSSLTFPFPLLCFSFLVYKNNHINKHWPRGSRPERNGGRGRNERGREEEGSQRGKETLQICGLSFGAPENCTAFMPGCLSSLALSILLLSQPVNKPTPCSS